MEKGKGALLMTDSELYQQYLKETAQPQPVKSTDSELYQQYLAETKQLPKTSALEAGITGIGQGASFGYLPQIQAATEPLIQKGLELIMPKSEQEKQAEIATQGFNVQTPESTYTQRRDEQIRQQQLLQKEHPYAFGAGEIGGGLTSAIASGGAVGRIAGATRPATLGGRIAQAAKTGAVIGAVRNPGDVEGEVSPLQLKERAKNIASDAATGAIFQGAIEGAGKVARTLKNAAPSLSGFAEKKALLSTGLTKGEYENILEKGTEKQIGRFALNEGIVKAGDSIEDIYNKANILKEKSANILDNIYNTSDELINKTPGVESFDLNKVVNEAASKIKSKYQGLAGSAQVRNRVDSLLEDIASNEPMTLSRAREIRGSIDDMINFSRDAKEVGRAQQALRDMRSEIQDKISAKIAEVDKANGTNLLKAFKDENKRYSNAASFFDLAQGGKSAFDRNAFFGVRTTAGTGFGSTVGGMAGGLPGAAIGGLAGGAAARASIKYGNPVVAGIAENAARALEKNPKALGKFSDTLIRAANISPQRYAAAINLAMKDPEFKSIVGAE